jgi:hypothetical protein
MLGLSDRRGGAGRRSRRRRAIAAFLGAIAVAGVAYGVTNGVVNLSGG